MREQLAGLKLDLEWRISLVTALLLPGLLLLGFWQLQRADEKTALASAWELRAQQHPAQLEDLDWHKPQSLAYVPVELRGSFSPDKYFLLDNRIHDGRFGYEVLSLFEPESGGGPVLVNRGWVPGDPGRLSLPEPTPVSGEVRITGHIYVAPGKPYLLMEQVLEPGWPKRIQAVEMDKILVEIGDSPGGRVFPYPVRIDTAQPGALTVDWKIINVSPEKHTGYAFQWFTLAAVLGLFYILRNSNLWQLISGKRSEL